MGLAAIAVTDHYTHARALRGTFHTERLAGEHGLAAFKGLEYSVGRGPRRGHVLVYFDHADQVPPRGLDLDALLDHARAEGLAVTHPHPFGFAGIRCPDLMAAADFVELNGSYGNGEVNQRLLRIARAAGLEDRLVANSDAHARGQMGAAYTLVDELHETVADTLATRRDAVIARPKRSWGRAAKTARAIAQPIGLAMNGVQKLTTRRAIAQLEAREAAAAPVT